MIGRLLCTDTAAVSLGDRVGDFDTTPIVGDTTVEPDILATAEVAYFSADACS